MGYSNIVQVEKILAQALTSSTPSDLTQAVDLLRIGNTLDTNQVTTEIVDQYIAWADSEINASISSLYTTPLFEHSDFETTLLSNIDDYNSYIVTSDMSPFYVGDTIVISDGTNEERHSISEIIDPIDMNVFSTSEAIGIGFSAGTRVLRVSYPSPIQLTSARLAAANIYDKYFMSQAAPGQSEYGIELRKAANQTLIDILSGGVILHGQHRIGRAFYNPTLLRQYGLEKELPGRGG